MTLPALSQWNAFMVETLFAKGMSVETLLHNLKNKDAETLNAYDQTFDYNDLVQAATQSPDQIEKAIQSGYTIKFVSNFGIKRLLHLKYGLEEGTDYKMAEARFDDLYVSETQLQEFKAMLSPNWKLFSEKNNDRYAVTIIHATQVDNN